MDISQTEWAWLIDGNDSVIVADAGKVNSAIGDCNSDVSTAPNDTAPIRNNSHATTNTGPLMGTIPLSPAGKYRPAK